MSKKPNRRKGVRRHGKRKRKPRVENDKVAPVVVKRITDLTPAERRRYGL
jgi:hypothetical protein